MALFHYNHSIAINVRECIDLSHHKILQRKRVWKIEHRDLSNATSNLRIPSRKRSQKVVAGLIELDETSTMGSCRKLQLGCLVSDEKWEVRRMVEREDEMRRVADVQAEAFHEPVVLFDDIFFNFFKAEVLSGLTYRLRNSPPDRYACLVAQPRNDQPASHNEVVGVVDITVQREVSILQHLPGAEEYLYVSGISVLKKYRRQKVATALLKACDLLSTIWGFEYLVLRAYEDDHGARKLYSDAGYRVVSGDAPWTTTWIGRRQRVVMVK